MKRIAAALAMVMTATIVVRPQSIDAPSQRVEIHAVVSDVRGEQLPDLGANDFEVLEDGEERPIEQVRFVDAAHEGRRVVAMLLDEYHVSAGPSADRVRASLTRFVREQLGPDDRVVVFKPLDSLLTIKLTSDREQVADAVASFEGRKGDYAPRNDFERDFVAADPRRVETVRTQISTAALNGLVTALAGIDSGRKALVFVSEGFGSADLRRGDQMPSAYSIVKAAQRAGVSIYPLDPSDSPADPDVQRRLKELADATDGVAAFGADNFDSGLARAIADVSRYYLVAFQSAASADGEFHQVQLRVRRRGASVSAPRGHWSASTEELYGASVAAATSERPPSPIAFRRTSLLIRPWFGITPGTDGSARVSFVWEPAARVPGTSARVPNPARVALRVSTLDGVSLYEGVVVPTASSNAGDARATFHAPPGTLLVEMSIEDASAKHLDTDVRDVPVASMDGPVALGTAQVFRTLTARQFREMAANADAIPVAARDFSRSERLLIRVPVHAADGSVDVRAKLTGALGQTIRTLSVDPGPTFDVRHIDLPLAGLVVGEYRLELTATRADAVVTQALDFRVVP